MARVPSETNNLQESFEDFFENSLCGFIIADSKGFIIRANSKIAGWMGCSPNDINGKKISDLLSIGGKIYYETHLAPLLGLQGSFDEVVVDLSSYSGQKLRVMINALQRKDEDGQPSFIRFTILKASDRLQYEQNLQQANNIAETELIKQRELVTLREQLIAVLGHDLRNPLSAISIAVDLLIATSAKSDLRLLTTIKKSSDRMAELVMNILDFARTRLGEGIVLKKQDMELEPVIEQLVAEMKLIYPTRDITTNFQVKKSVFCDEFRIAQLVSNLLSNALNHGSNSSPVHVNAKEVDGDVEISVTNKGTPIPPDFHQNIFAPFKREGNRPSQNGLGLGLFICSEIAQAHGGNLSFTSDVEETCFTFRLNCKKPS